jgi:hypothetical protein
MVVVFVLGIAFGFAVTGAAQTDRSAQIKDALAAMKADTAKLGQPTVVDGSLLFGTTRMNGNYGLVDSLKARFGCMATFFVKKGDGFIRVSTTVMKDGKRADGTPLDPNGPAIAAIRKGEPFYGLADVLGSRYLTGYEPIKDAAGAVIGIYFVGHPTKQ